MESSTLARRLRTLSEIPGDAPDEGGAWAVPILFPGGIVALRSAIETIGAAPRRQPRSIQVGGRPRFDPFAFRGTLITWVPGIRTVDTVFVSHSGHQVECTSLEEALVDCIRRPDLAGGADALVEILSDIRPGAIDFGRVETILSRYANKSLWQRTGYLVSLFQDNLRPPGRFSWTCREKAWGVRSAIHGDGDGVFVRQWEITVPESLTAERIEKKRMSQLF